MFTLFSIPSLKSTRQVIKRFSFPIDLTDGKYSNIKIIFQKGHTQVLHKRKEVKDHSFVWLSSGWNNRDIAYAMRLHLEAAKTPHTYVEKNSSKITDYMLFGINGLPISDTIFINHSNIKEEVSLIKRICGFPVIVKDIRGCQGKYSRLAFSEEDLLEKTKNLPKSRKFLFQKYIPNDYDWGVMVVNGVAVSAEKSYPAAGEFRNNACNGARECFVDIKKVPENIKKIAVKANDVLGLSWSRADIIVDRQTKLPYLLEVNRYPGVTPGSSEMASAYEFLASHILASS